VGTVLVNGAGYTLYLFEPDHQDGSTCSGSCASAWPPYLLPAGVTAARATGAASAALLGTLRRSDGSLEVTYDRWPLYTWVGDTRPGVATGEGLDQFGGYWYALRPDGAAVKP
jgi:predicted lipoprotein with Yx(FWY)xxD motif